MSPLSPELTYATHPSQRTNVTGEIGVIEAATGVGGGDSFCPGRGWTSEDCAAVSLPPGGVESVTVVAESAAVSSWYAGVLFLGRQVSDLAISGSTWVQRAWGVSRQPAVIAAAASIPVNQEPLLSGRDNEQLQLVEADQVR
jgi:hypothetical protein